MLLYYSQRWKQEMIDCRNKSLEEIKEIEHSLYEQGYGTISCYPYSDRIVAKNIVDAFNYDRTYTGRNTKKYCLHNGIIFLSTENIDEIDIMVAFKGVFPKNEEERKIEREKMNRELHPHIYKMIDFGNSVLDEKYHEIWKKLVFRRMDDMYCGADLLDSISIIKLLNKGNFKEAEKLINSQGHSCFSFSVVLQNVRHLCDNGEKFYERMK